MVPGSSWPYTAHSKIFTLFNVSDEGLGSGLPNSLITVPSIGSFKRQFDSIWNYLFTEILWQTTPPLQTHLVLHLSPIHDYTSPS